MNSVLLNNLNTSYTKLANGYIFGMCRGFQSMTAFFIRKRVHHYKYKKAYYLVEEKVIVKHH